MLYFCFLTLFIWMAIAYVEIVLLKDYTTTTNDIESFVEISDWKSINKDNEWTFIKTRFNKVN